MFLLFVSYSKGGVGNFLINLHVAVGWCDYFYCLRVDIVDVFTICMLEKDGMGVFTIHVFQYNSVDIFIVCVLQ